MSESMFTESAPIEQAEVEYRDIPGFPGYRVGSDGSVWSFNKPGPFVGLRSHMRRMKASVDRDGYLYVTLSVRKQHCQKRVHELVLLAFVGERPHGTVACHFPDRNPANNHVRNLRWGTFQDNSDDMVAHGTVLKGEQIAISKLTVEQVLEIHQRLNKPGCLIRALAREFGVTGTNIRSIRDGRSWSHITGRPRRLFPPEPEQVEQLEFGT